MQFRNVVALGLIMALVSTAAVGAQGRGGGGGGGSRGGGGPAPEVIGDVSKAALKKIKLVKLQSDSVKALTKSFEAREKEYNRLAQMVGGRSSGGGGGGSRGGGGGGGPRTGAPSGGGGGSQLATILAELHQEYTVELRKIMAEDQRPVFDSNLVAYQAKKDKALAAAAAARSRGGRGG